MRVRIVVMRVEVKYFASLRERFGRGAEQRDVPAGSSVGDLWRELSGEQILGDNLRAAVNYEYVGPDAVLQPNDEVAFFPPVTGG